VPPGAALACQIPYLDSFPDAREPGLTGYHSKEGFITQKKLLDKAVTILKYRQPNGL
jgi:hypothetical protein